LADLLTVLRKCCNISHYFVNNGEMRILGRGNRQLEDDEPSSGGPGDVDLMNGERPDRAIAGFDLDPDGEDGVVMSDHGEGLPVLPDDLDFEAYLVGPELTEITLDNFKDNVDLVFEWLRDDIEQSPERFFGKYEEMKTLDVKGVALNFTDSDILLSVVDDSFYAFVMEVVGAMLEQRENLAYENSAPIVQDDLVMIVYEMFRTTCFHEGRFRDNGGFKYIVHPQAVTKSFIKKSGVASVPTVLGIYGHDNGEDIGFFEDDEDVLDPELYQHRCEHYDTSRIKAIRDRTLRFQRGMTKIKMVSDDDISPTMQRLKYEPKVDFTGTAEATFFNMIRHILDEIRALLGKGCDRIDNLEDILEAKGPDKAKDTCRVTMETLYPLIDTVIQARLIRRGLIDGCARVLNPELYREFYAKLAEARKKIDGMKSRVEQVLAEIPSVKELRVEESGLDYHVRDLYDVALEDLTFNMFSISDMDPMHEFVVLVDGNDPVRFVAEQLFDALGLVRYHQVSYLPEDMLGNRDRDGADFDLIEELPFVQKGIVITGYSKKFGTQIRLRVNDQTCEHRMIKGILGNHHEAAAPAALKSTLSDLIRKRMMHEIDDVLVEAKREFLKPRTRFTTPDDDNRVLPCGSTGLDAALKIHSDMLIGLVGIDMTAEGTIGKRKANFRIFDEVPVISRGELAPVFHFKTVVPRNGRGDENVLKALPVSIGWRHLCLCDSTKRQLERFFCDPYAYMDVHEKEGGRPVCDEEKRISILKNGRNYREQLDGIFGKEVIDAMILPEVFEGNDDSINYYIGMCSLDPFERLIEYVEDRDSWTLEVDMPDQDGILLEILPYFKKMGLSIHPLGGFGKDGYDVFRYKVSYPKGSEKNKIDTKKLFTLFLKLSYEYKIRVLDFVEGIGSFDEGFGHEGAGI